jgi:hypothetical protein
MTSSLKELIAINDNGNGGLESKPSMTNDIGISEAQVEFIAEKLVTRFGSSLGDIEKWKPFYCKLARALPEGKIWALADIAETRAKRSKGGYFTTLACKEMGYRPERGRP